MRFKINTGYLELVQKLSLPLYINPRYASFQLRILTDGPTSSHFILADFDRHVMVAINTIDINPPLLNSSCAWASDWAQLRELYDSPYTGAITTRTATLNGFGQDETHTVYTTLAANRKFI